MRLPLLFVVLPAALAASLSACGSSGSKNTANSPPATSEPCSKASLDLTSPGKLTIATDNPSFPPWFIGTKPDSPWDPTTPPTKKGYEAQVAYAVAKQLGFSDAAVKWVVAPFTTLFKPGSKNYDFDLNQVSYKPVRAKAVGFSDSYYDVEQAVVTYKGSKIAAATTIAGLKDAKLGAQLGTTSYDAIGAVIKPGPDPSVYDTNNDVVSALKAKQIDGAVVDYPTSLYMAYVQLEGVGGSIPGRLPRAAGDTEHFGLVTTKGSRLIPCLNKALAALRRDGTLNRLQQKWIVGSAPPVLK